MKKMINTVQGKYFAMLATLHVALLGSTPVMAQGKKLSDMAKHIKTEASTIMPVVMLLFAAIGVVITGTAIKSIIDAKKNRERLTWEVWGVIGGSALTVVVLIVYSVAGSLNASPSGLGDLGL